MRDHTLGTAGRGRDRAGFRCPTEYDRDQKTGQWVSKALATVAEALKQLAGLAGMQLEVGPSAFVLRPAADQE